MLLFWKATALTLPFWQETNPCHWWEAMQKLEKLGVLTGFDAEKLKGGSDYEGLMKAIINDQDPLTSGYKKEYPLLLQLRKLD